MGFLSGLKGIGFLGFGCHPAEAYAKAQRHREVDQLPAALLCLEECLERVGHRHDQAENVDYAACVLLLAECQSESGLARGDIEAVRMGLETLLRSADEYPAYYVAYPNRWRAVLGLVDSDLEEALDARWLVGRSKEECRAAAIGLANAFCSLGEFVSATRAAERGLRIFPGDPNLLFSLAYVAAAQGSWARSLALTRESMSTGQVPAGPAEVISLLDAVIQADDGAAQTEAEALKGEVLRRTDRWDEAYACFFRAETRAPGELPDFAIEGFLLSSLRKRNLAEVERYGAVYSARGFNGEGMKVVAAAVRTALERSPERKHLWLIWSQLCLQLGRLGEALQGVSRSLAIDTSLAEGVLAGCRSVDSPATDTATFRIGLARVILASGDVRHGVEALEWFDSPESMPDALAAATELCRDTLSADPSCHRARECLVRLLLRQNALDEALSNGREAFRQTGDVESAAALAWRIAGASQGAANTEAGDAARDFELEAWQKAGDDGAVLEGIAALASHPGTSRPALERGLSMLRGLSLKGSPLELPAHMVTAQILGRIGELAQAAAVYRDVVLVAPRSEILERACQGLRDHRAQLSGAEGVDALLAAKWLELRNPIEAGGPLAECVSQGCAETSKLVELLEQRCVESPDCRAWLDLGGRVADLLIASSRDDFRKLGASLRATLAPPSPAPVSVPVPAAAPVVVSPPAPVPVPAAKPASNPVVPVTPAGAPTPVVKPAPALVLAKPGTPPVEVPAAPVVNSASKPEAPKAPTSGTDPATVPTVTAPAPAAASPAAEAKPRPATKRRSLRETLASEMVEMDDAKAASTPAARTPTRSTGEVRPPRSADAEMPPASIAPRPNAASDGPPGSQRSRLAARLRSETVDFQSAREGRRETAPASDQLDRVTRPVLRRTTPKILPDPTPVAPVPLSGPAAEAKELLGVALEATRKKDFETARQLLQKALALNPEDRLVRYNLGLVGGKTAKSSTPAVPPAS